MSTVYRDLVLRELDMMKLRVTCIIVLLSCVASRNTSCLLYCFPILCVASLCWVSLLPCVETCGLRVCCVATLCCVCCVAEEPTPGNTPAGGK